jgi:hypothetical protein
MGDPNLEEVKKVLEERDPIILQREMVRLQNAVYIMCGGGRLGRFAAEQPLDFYIDPRVCKLPYGRKDITKAVDVLKIYVAILGKDAIKSDYADFHNCGIW